MRSNSVNVKQISNCKTKANHVDRNNFNEYGDDIQDFQSPNEEDSQEELSEE